MTVFLSEIQQFVSGSADQIDQIMAFMRELLVERFNIMSALRTYPVGIPSLMSARLPVEVPYGAPHIVDVTTFGNGILWFIVLSIIGMALGTFYYLVVAQAALQGSPQWRLALKNLPWALWQVFTLTMVWLIIAVAISIPFSCIIPVLSIGGVSQLLSFVYLAIVVWLFFPLILSTHGIFVYKEKMVSSLLKSVHLTRLTLPATSIFLLLVFLAMQGFGVIWGWPREDSWLMLIGLAGHAFVATGLLAASFIYYREADQWTQRFLRQVILQRHS
jgi:hypothetical protein